MHIYITRKTGYFWGFSDKELTHRKDLLEVRSIPLHGSYKLQNNNWVALTSTELEALGDNDNDVITDDVASEVNLDEITEYIDEKFKDIEDRCCKGEGNNDDDEDSESNTQVVPDLELFGNAVNNNGVISRSQ